MPLYEYRCRKCGAQIEKIQKFSDPLLTTCENCGGELEQLLSAPAIQFKGSGWYVTDYGKAGSDIKPSGNKAEGKKADGDKATAEKSDKPAVKSEDSAAKPSAKPAESAPAKS